MFIITLDDYKFDLILIFLCDKMVKIWAVVMSDFHNMIIVANLLLLL